MARLLTRRRFLTAAAGFTVAGLSLVGYALAIEPRRLIFPRYRLTPAGWPPGLRLKIAVLADLHASRPWMTAAHIRWIVQETNAHRPDIVLLLGDYVTHHHLVMQPEQKEAWAMALAGLVAPLGIHAVLGNHDWWEDAEVQRRRSGPTPAGTALEAVGIPVYENRSVRIEKDGIAFWLAGLGDQWAFFLGRVRSREADNFGYGGVDDIEATLRQVTDDAPVLMMAHEPDVFARMPDRVSLTLSGHTHGGQVQFFGYAPIVPSRFGQRYLHGHVRERGRDLIVSGGLGCTGLPIRFGRPPEVPLIELG